MGRRLGILPTVLVAAVAIGLGVGAGALIRGWAPPRSRTAAQASSSPDARPAVRSAVIGARNVLTTNDLAVAGWTGAHLDSVGNGTAQFAKACEHGSERGMGDGEVTAVYVRGPDGADEFGQQSTFSFGIPPQERAAYRRINGFYRDCPRSTVRRLPTPAGVDGDVWRIRAGQPGGDAYAVVVRVGDRIGWASLYDLRKPVAPSQVPSLATALDRRLRR